MRRLLWLICENDIEVYDETFFENYIDNYGDDIYCQNLE
jgi:hypothetical protein